LQKESSPKPHVLVCARNLIVFAKLLLPIQCPLAQFSVNRQIGIERQIQRDLFLSYSATFFSCRYALQIAIQRIFLRRPRLYLKKIADRVLDNWALCGCLNLLSKFVILPLSVDSTTELASDKTI